MTPPPRHFRPRACLLATACWRCPRPPRLPHRQHRAICCLQPLSRVVGALQGRARLQAVLPYPGSSRPTGRRHRPAVPARRHGAGGRLAGRVRRMAPRASPIAVRLRSPARTSPRATGASSISSRRRAMPWSRRITGVGQSVQPCLSACAHCRAQRHRHDQGQPPVPRQRGAVAALGLGRPFAGRCRRAHGGPHRPSYGGPSLQYRGSFTTGTPTAVELTALVMKPDNRTANPGALNAYHAYLLDGLLQAAPQIDRVLSDEGRARVAVAREQCRANWPSPWTARTPAACSLHR